MMLNKTFHLILLSLIPIFGFSQANSQYPDSGNKIRLGFQTTSDGLIWRDTQPKVGGYQPINNKAAWIILDTMNNKFYHYKNSTWTLAGGQDIDTANLIATKYNLGFKLSLADTQNMLTPYWRSGRFSGVLPVENGGTGQSTLTANKVMVGNVTSGVLTPTDLHWDNSNALLGIGETSLSTFKLTVKGAFPILFNTTATANTLTYGGTRFFRNTSTLNNGNGFQYSFNDANGNAAEYGYFGGYIIDNTVGSTDGGFIFAPTLNNSRTEAMRILNNGNVGIGVPNPTEKLHVSGNGLFTGSMSLGTPLTVANGGTGASVKIFVDTFSNQTVNGLKTFKDSLFLGNVIIGKTKQNNNSIRFGINAGLSTADRNVAIGTNTLQVNTGNEAGLGENVAIGFNAGKSLTTGTRNMLLGAFAGEKITDSGSNVAFGGTALFNLLTGGENVAVGRASMEGSPSGSSNTAVGAVTLRYNEGNFNTAIGYWAGWANSTNNNTTGSNNTFIGNNAVGSSPTVSNVITLGNSSIATIRAQVTTITSLSDIRDKTDILPLNYGMNFIDKLKPVSFIWDMRDGGKIGIPEIGFIAQDLQQAQIDSGINIPNLVSGVDEKLEASYGVLLPIIVKALQEANDKIKSLEKRILNLENK